MKCPNCGHEIKTDLLGEPIRAQNPVQGFIASYCEAYKSKYGTNPIGGGKNAGIAKRIVDAVGGEKAKRYAWAYLAMKDPEFLSGTHDLVTMERRLAKIAVAADTGKVVTRTEINLVDRKETIKSAFDHLREPEE